MDPVALLQTTLTGFGIAASKQMSNCTVDIPSNGTTSWASVSENPTSLFSLPAIVSLLLSFSALRDWLKLFVIGGAIETCRRTALRLWATLVESFWITACFDEHDESYNWIMFWLSKHPKWSQARMVDVSTRSFGLNSPAVSISEETEDTDNNKRGRKLCYLPSFSRTYSLWYKGHYLGITRTQAQDGFYGSTRESLRIDILARRHDFLNDLLLEARKAYRAAEEHLISVYVSESGGSWRHVASRPKRPLNSIVLDPGMKDLLLDDARDFLQSKEWYAQRGIPFRRGYLFYGAPGSGKTSMIHSLAGELGLDVYIVTLSRAGLDDTSLSELISDLPERCIALMEDIDAAFTSGISRDIDDKDADDDESSEGRERAHEKEKNASAPVSRVTLSGLLNALDGVAAQEGRILYATTNCYHALDAALCRPGRMDLHVEFKLSSRYQARELFKCFYLPDSEKVAAEERPSRSQSAHSSPASSRSSSTSRLIEPEPSLPSTEKPSQGYVGTRHCAETLKLSKEEVLDLAEQFAETIPEREFSMASLQGYLMTYKIRPHQAAEDAAAWVKKEQAKKAKKNDKL